MNRTIKFRGKRTENGEWVYGLLSKNSNGEFIIVYDEEKLWIKTQSNKIIPATVGQFTGLLDSKGREIYENDIVEAATHEGAPIVGRVKFRKNVASFEICTEYNQYSFVCLMNIKVTGNIHDNLELLK